MAKAVAATICPERIMQPHPESEVKVVLSIGLLQSYR